MRVIDEQKKIYEVLGIAILEEEEGFSYDNMLFLLDDGFEVEANKVKIIDNRVPFDWHINILKKGYYLIMGFKELTYSIDLFEWDRCGNAEAGRLMQKYIKNIKKKKWQEKLDYYDENVHYTKMMENMNYRFLED